MSDLMKGKRGLIMGVANDKSIAWGIAREMAAQGAELAFTYQGEAFGKRVQPLAASLGLPWRLHLARHPWSRPEPWAALPGGEFNVDASGAQDLQLRVAQLPDSTTAIGYRFAAAMRGVLDYMGVAEQVHKPVNMPDQVIGFHKACRGDTARPLGDDSNGTNCLATMAEGSTCAAKCSSGVTANGSFLCLAGTVRLESVCPGLGSVTMGDKVLFTLGAVASQCPSPQQLRGIIATDRKSVV